MRWLFTQIGRFFDVLEEHWEGAYGQRQIANLLVFSFVGGMVVIELSRQGWLPPWLADLVPTNHFYAVDFTFRLLLVAELIELTFGLAHSVANSVGKQIEILSLILLRETFKEFTHFNEPIEWVQVEPVILSIVADAAGALVVFVILGFYYHMQRHRAITEDAQSQASFITAKKIIALGLLAAFMLIGVYSLQQYLLVGENIPFFDACYTVLIFADVLVVLVSLRYSSTYAVVFRNSGFAIATVLIRLALIAPPPFNAVLGVGAALFALGLTVAYNRFAPQLESEEALTAPPVPESAAVSRAQRMASADSAPRPVVGDGQPGEGEAPAAEQRAP